jgi:Nucleolar pre-ribosomal-associated protein 1
VWLRFFDSLQLGFCLISEGTKVEGKPLEKHFPRAASISTQILAEFTKILPNSLHNTYNVVANYLAVREKFDFAAVPEMLVLFHSSDVHQSEQRLFILNAIAHGIKDDLDFKLLNQTPLLKMIFSCYGCPMSDRKIDSAILKIVNRIVTKTNKIEILITRYGLALWIFQAAAKVEAFEYDAIEMILSLIEHSVEAIKTQFKSNDESMKRMLASLLVLLPKFTKTRLTGASFLSFLTAINGTKQFGSISGENHDLIMDLMKVFFSDNHQQQLVYLNEHPTASKYLETKDEFSNSIDTDSATAKMLVESRDFLLNYNARVKREKP